jgi:hypothetical protein
MPAPLTADCKKRHSSALVVSEAVLTGGRSNVIGRPFRAGQIRSTQSLIAVGSPSFAALTTARNIVLQEPLG